MIIYKVTNRVTGELYIGQSSKTLEERRSQHKNRLVGKYNNNTRFYRALRVYGWDNFDWCVIDTTENQTELDSKEIYWIKHYNSMNKGYNMTSGGMELNPMDSDIVKQEHADIVNSNQFRSSISKTVKDMWANMPQSKYDKRSESIARKMAGNRNGMSQAVNIRAIDKITGDSLIFESRSECSRYLGVSTAAVSNGFNKGHIVRGHIIEKLETNIPRVIEQRNLVSGEVLKEHKSVGYAAREIDPDSDYQVARSAIDRNLRGITSSARGYIWTYKE